MKATFKVFGIELFTLDIDLHHTPVIPVQTTVVDKAAKWFSAKWVERMMK